MNRIFYPLIVVLIFFFTVSSYAQIEKTEKQLINEFVQKKRAFNKEYGYGFRIQLYNGFEIEAKKIRAKFSIDFPDIKTFLIYQQPEWKIQIGHYRTRLEADRALLSLKRKFRNAIVIPLGK